MTVIDIIFGIFAAYGFYVGFSRGIIKTIFTVLSYMFGLLAAFKFAPSVTRFLENSFDSTNPMMFIAGFLLAFFLTMIVIRMFAKALENVLQSANVNFVNQFAGGVLMAGIMIFVYSLVLWFFNASNLIKPYTKENSITYRYLERFPGQVWGLGKTLKPTFEDFWQRSVEFMDDLNNADFERTESEPEIYDIQEDDTASNQ